MKMYTSVCLFLILELTDCVSTYTAVSSDFTNNPNTYRRNNNNNIISDNNRSIWTRFKLISGPNSTPRTTGRLNEGPNRVYKVIQNKNNKTEVRFITLNPNLNLVIHSKHYNSSVNISNTGRDTNSERKRVPMGSVKLSTKLVNATQQIVVHTERPQLNKVVANDHGPLVISEIGRRRRRPPPIIRDQEVEEEEEEEDDDDDDDDYGISEVTETVEEDLEDDEDDDDDDNEEVIEDPVDEVTHKIQPQYAVIPQPVFLHQDTRPVHSSATAVVIPKRTLKNKLGRGKHKIKKRLKKFMLPLLLAYKLKFLILVPLLMGALVLIVGTTGFAGFFFALFVVGLGLQKKWS